ncbi:hypothetical protein TNCV_3333111 [Trichonephila clavipes]|nr:hypothetical protein TNCV_3333111 [Trichonephila clavipes]
MGQMRDSGQALNPLIDVGPKLPSHRSVAGDWKYTRIYNPQRRLRVLVERCRKDSSHRKLGHTPGLQQTNYAIQPAS